MMIKLPWTEEKGKHSLKCTECGKVYDYIYFPESDRDIEEIEMEAIMDKWEFSDEYGVLCPDCVKELADETIQ